MTLKHLGNLSSVIHIFYGLKTYLTIIEDVNCLLFFLHSKDLDTSESINGHFKDQGHLKVKVPMPPLHLEIDGERCIVYTVYHTFLL